MCVVVTCEVAHRLQFEGLQDGFKRSHLDVHLLVDLHVVVIQVWLLMMSSSKQRWKQQQPVRRQNLQMLSGCRICSVHLPCGETLRWLPSASSPVQWTDKRNTKWASLQLSSCACKHHITLFSHTHKRAHHVGDSAALQVDVQFGFRSNFLSLLLNRNMVKVHSLMKTVFQLRLQDHTQLHSPHILSHLKSVFQLLQLSLHFL